MTCHHVSSRLVRIDSFSWRACLFGALFSASTILPALAAGESKGKKIAYLQSLATHPYVAATTKSFRSRAEALGMEITILTSMLDAALQAQQIDDAIARRFDVVVVAPTSEQAVVPALARAKQAGVPVIIINNTPKDGTEELYLTFVGQDQVAMGRLAGVAMLEALKASGRAEGKVAMITGALQQGIAPRRVAGFREVMKTNPKVEIAAVEDARWDTATVGGGAKPLVVVGGNCLKEGIEAIKAGKMQATVSQIPTDLGLRTADVIDEHFSGKKLPKEVLLPITTITKANEPQWEAPCTY